MSSSRTYAIRQVTFFCQEKTPHPPSSANPSVLSPKIELAAMKADSVKSLVPVLISTAM